TSGTLELPPPNGGTEVFVFAVGASHQLGRYRVRGAFVSAEGTVGPATETEVELVRNRGVRAPWIDSVQSTKDRTMIRIRGGGFTDSKLLVTIGAEQVPVHKATARELSVAAPPNLNQPGEVI